jgi:hypothetical protein
MLSSPAATCPYRGCTEPSTVGLRHSISAIFNQLPCLGVYMSLGLTWLRGQRRGYFSNQLFARFVEADRRVVRVLGQMIGIQDVFHGADKGCIGLGRDTPFLFQPRLEFIFLTLGGWFRAKRAQRIPVRPFYRLTNVRSSARCPRVPPKTRGSKAAREIRRVMGANTIDRRISRATHSIRYHRPSCKCHHRPRRNRDSRCWSRGHALDRLGQDVWCR